MMPGPDYIIECPNCSEKFIKNSLMSGNTFGAKLFSDGKRIAPMLPDFPAITKCDHCKKYYWIDEAKVTGELSWHSSGDEERGRIKEVRFPELDELFEALKSEVNRTKKKEIFIRQNIVWSFNDRVREGKTIFKEADDENNWRENILGLLHLLDLSNFNDRISIAELNRNLGNFQKCEELMDAIKEETFIWLTNDFKEQCQKKNTEVFQFKDRD